MYDPGSKTLHDTNLITLPLALPSETQLLAAGKTSLGIMLVAVKPLPATGCTAREAKAFVCPMDVVWACRCIARPHILIWWRGVMFWLSLQARCDGRGVMGCPCAAAGGVPSLPGAHVLAAAACCGPASSCC